MNKTINTVILFFLGQSVIAQKGIDNLIRAEKDFAAYSVEHSTKEAFEKFIDSNSIMFDDGKPVKAIEFWDKREKNAGVLNWWPQYAEISGSGDFGYTTGPWTFQPTKNDSIAARGQYTTFWRINENGEWKFLVDLGVSNTPVNLVREVRIINAAKLTASRLFLPPNSPVVNAENSFSFLFVKNKVKAYKKGLSEQSILSRNGLLPAITATEQRAIIHSTPSSIKYTMNGWNTSPVYDLGYTYGTTVINGKTENYFRIWRSEKTGWKIAVEVLRY